MCQWVDKSVLITFKILKQISRRIILFTKKCNSNNINEFDKNLLSWRGLVINYGRLDISGDLKIAPFSHVVNK